MGNEAYFCDATNYQRYEEKKASITQVPHQSLLKPFKLVQLRKMDVALNQPHRPPLHIVYRLTDEARQGMIGPMKTRQGPFLCSRKANVSHGDPV